MSLRAHTRLQVLAAPAVVAVAAVALVLLPGGLSLGAGDAGISFAGLSRATAWVVVWSSAMVLLAAAASRRSVPPGAWAIPPLALGLAVARMPVALVGLLLVVAIAVPRLAPGMATPGWSRTLSLGTFAAFATVGADIAGRRHGDDVISTLVVLGFLALVGAVPFGRHMVRWMQDAGPEVGALVAAVLLPGLLTALVFAEPALVQARATQRAGFLLALFGGATVLVGALHAMGARDWREFAVRTTSCEVGLALVGIGAFDLRGLQGAALTLALLAATRPVLFFVDRLGPRRGAGLVVAALALVGVAGLPPTLGFPARQLVLSAAARIHPLVAGLVAAGLLLQLAALALVLRRRLARPADDNPDDVPAAATALTVATAVVLLVGGVFPGLLLRFVFRLGAG